MKLTPEIKQEIQRLLEKGAKTSEIIEGVKQKFDVEVAQQTIKNYRSKLKKSTDELEKAPEAPKDMDVNKVMDEAFKSTVWLYRHYATTAQKQIENEGESRINFKQLAEIAEKVMRYQSTAQKNNISGKGTTTIDSQTWKDLAKLYIVCKNDPLVEYDERAHIEALINKATGKDESN